MWHVTTQNWVLRSNATVGLRNAGDFSLHSDEPDLVSGRHFAPLRASFPHSFYLYYKKCPFLQEVCPTISLVLEMFFSPPPAP